MERKSPADRKDKGTAKKSMAAILSSVDVVESEKSLLKDAEFGLNLGEIESQINDDQRLAEGLLNIANGDRDETETAELCRKKYSNLKKVEEANR